MCMRPYTDYPRDEVGYVDKFIGTAFDVVFAVYKDLATIDTIPSEVIKYGTIKDSMDVDVVTNTALSKAADKSAQAASVSAQEALNSKQAAADLVKTASGIAKTYVDITQGLAGTTDGQYFTVVGSGDVYSYSYLNQGGKAVLQGTLSSASYIDWQYNRRILNDYGILTGGLKSYAAYALNDQLQFCFRDKTGTDHWLKFDNSIVTQAALDTKFNKAGDVITYGGRKAFFQPDGNLVFYGTDNAINTTIKDGSIWTSNDITSTGNTHSKGVLSLTSKEGSPLNEMQMSVDAKGVWGVWVQNSFSNGFKNPISYVPQGNFDLYGATGLYYNHNAVWHTGNMGAGSGMNADMVDGLHGSDLATKASVDALNTFLQNQVNKGIFGSYGMLKGGLTGYSAYLLNNVLNFCFKDDSGADHWTHFRTSEDTQAALDTKFDKTGGDITYGGRKASFQPDGSFTLYGANNTTNTTIKDGTIWTQNAVKCNGNIRGKDILSLTSTLGSSLNEIDMHMDYDGVWRVYVQNAFTNGFKNPISYIPTGNFDLYGAGGLYYNHNTIWHAGNMGAGSGLNADTVDGLHGADLAKQFDNNNIWNVLNNDCLRTSPELAAGDRKVYGFHINKTDGKLYVVYQGADGNTKSYPISDLTYF